MYSVINGSHVCVSRYMGDLVAVIQGQHRLEQVSVIVTESDICIIPPTTNSAEQEMKNLGQWLEEVEILEETLENLSYIICHHSQLLRREFQTHQPEDTSQVLTVVGS